MSHNRSDSGASLPFLSTMMGKLVTVSAIAFAAFILGALIFGGGSSNPHSDEQHSAGAEQSAPTIWTCSMHPQIKLPKPGKCPICFMDLIPLTQDDSDELDPTQIKMSEAAKTLARIESVPVTRGFGRSDVRMLGRLTYDETRMSYITAWVGGRLDRLFADYRGMRVSEGDHLVQIYSPVLLSAQEELIQANKILSSLSSSNNEALLSTAEATLTAAREKLRLYGLSQEQIDITEQSGIMSEHLTINAPIGGVIVHKDATEGMYVKTGTRIYTIADLSKLWVMLEAYESDLPWLRYGQKVQFTSESFPGETFEALISFIDPVVDPKKRTVRVRAIVDNDSGRLKPDMFVRAVVGSVVDRKGNVVDATFAGKWISPMHPEIVKDMPGQCDICGMDLVTASSLGYANNVDETKTAPLLIPASAPMITGKRSIVYVELPNNEKPLFEGREVTLGPRAGDSYIVLSGLSEGELVVTNGAFKLDAELQIRAKPSMMSPDGGVRAPGHDHGSEHAGHTMPPSENKAAAAQSMDENKVAIDALTPVYQTYFDVQMALANDDHSAAQAAANKLKAAVGSVDMSLFSTDGHVAWMKLLADITKHSTTLVKSDDIALARTAFSSLSVSIVDLHATFGHSENTDYFVTFCPMARDGKGAHWLQEVDTVWNSYYGEMMLRCGEIQKPLPPGMPAGL